MLSSALLLDSSSGCDNGAYCVKLSTADVGSVMTYVVHSLNPVCNVDCLMFCTCSVYWRHLERTLSCSTAPKPWGSGRGSILKNNPFTVLYDIISVVGIFRGTLYNYEIWGRVNIRHHVYRCGLGSSMRACHAAGPGSIPGRDKFPGWGFFSCFFLTCKTNVGKV